MVLRMQPVAAVAFVRLAVGPQLLQLQAASGAGAVHSSYNVIAAANTVDRLTRQVGPHLQGDVRKCGAVRSRVAGGWRRGGRRHCRRNPPVRRRLRRHLCCVVVRARMLRPGGGLRQAHALRVNLPEAQKSQATSMYSCNSPILCRIVVGASVPSPGGVLREAHAFGVHLRHHA